MNQIYESLFKELVAVVPAAADMERVRDWSSIWSRFMLSEANQLQFRLWDQLREELNGAFD